jgi:hypothetical protein
VRSGPPSKIYPTAVEMQLRDGEIPPRFSEMRVLMIRKERTESVAGVEGLEPPTLGLEIRCSIRLSYTPAINQHHTIR